MIADAKIWPSWLSEPSPLQESIHERTWDQRTRIITALADTWQPKFRKSATKLNECSRGAAFFIDPSIGKVKPWLARCRHRLCPFCAKARSIHVSNQIQRLILEMKTPRTMVLTVKSSATPLKEQLRTLRRNFAALRKRPDWKSRCIGGVYTVEVTQNPDTKLWHPHLHVVYDGEFFPQKLLRRLWHEVTGSAEIVWLQAITDVPGMANELAKYIGKIQKVETLDNASIRDYAQAVNGSRMLQTFGNCHGKTVKDQDPGPTESPDTYTIKLGRLVTLARAGFQTPQTLVHWIAKRYPIFSSYILHQLPQLDPAEPAHLRKAKLRAHLYHTKPPPRPKRPSEDEMETIDTRLFLAFTKYRQEDAAGTFAHFDYFAPNRGAPV